MEIRIIYEDDHVICAQKPNNVVVHHAFHSRNVSDEASLLQLLQQHTDDKLYPIHRLDRKTSGLILLAKDTSFVSDFQQLFTNNLIKKIYYGVVRGHAPEKLIIDSPVKGRDANAYKDAETLLETVQKITLDIPVKPYETSRYSLVRLTPATGRLHQLRIHTNKISHPLIGDPKYGDKNHNIMFKEQFHCESLFLHAHSLSFIHPYTDKKITLTAHLPNHWQTIFDRFGWEV